MIQPNWIEELLKKAKDNTRKKLKEHNNQLEFDLINQLIDDSYQLHSQNEDLPLGKFLASAV
jgi:hypothetical protein